MDLLANDPVAKSRARFVRDTTEHAMKVVLDQGAHRHLRFRDPATMTYWFDLVTWPGHLAIVGDCGSYVFARTTDMFEFFEPSGARGGFEDERWGINPTYWSEKLQAPRGPDAALVFSYEKFSARVREWFKEVEDDLDPTAAAALREALQESVLGEHYFTAHEAHDALNRFEHNGHRIHDAWEWDMREYDWSFLWCCWAIVWGISQYRLQSPTSATGGSAATEKDAGEGT